ncbi:hypothetical protein F4780DRAFT_788725 [Xylariomycetidae sp. FL0641]|nr:hypothetical protein F4780DRAFT_788725 [Xylariomycetidae sp. FL0641]
MASYPYAAPPPAPPAAAPPSAYPSYAQGSPYAHPRGGHGPVMNGGRARSHHQGPGHSDYGSPQYQQQDFASPATQSPYTPSPQSSYWPSPSHINHQPAASLPPSSYHGTYASQAYAPQPTTSSYQSQYPPQSSRMSYGPSYSQPTSDYSSQQWNDPAHSYPSYTSRGGRPSYSGDRGGHKADHAMAAPMRMGFDQRYESSAPSSSPYGQSYPSSSHHSAPYQQPSYNYPPPPNPPSVPVPTYSGSAPSHYNSSHRGGAGGHGHGRDNFGHGSRGGRSNHSERGDKFRHRDHRHPHGHHHPPHQQQHQKSDAAMSKKKKRKTNTLGLTPGDGDSDDGTSATVNEEARLSELLGNDVPAISDMAAWIAERKANFPTKQRVAAKKADEEKRVASGHDTKQLDSKAPAAKVDKDQAEADRLRKRLAKVERKLEKRKRAENDEGDEMRGSVSDSSDDGSDDEKPETQPTGKASAPYLPPPPITRADPTNHCKYYSTGGTCGKKGKCRFVHDPAVREAALLERNKNGGKMTLKQRLLLNDKDHSDMEVVKAIVQMRTTGRLNDPQDQAMRSDKQAKEPAAIAAPKSTLPTTAGAANLPPNPLSGASKADRPNAPYGSSPKYQNMYLGGFSNPNKNLKLRELP